MSVRTDTVGAPVPSSFAGQSASARGAAAGAANDEHPAARWRGAPARVSADVARRIRAELAQHPHARHRPPWWERQLVPGWAPQIEPPGAGPVRPSERIGLCDSSADPSATTAIDRLFEMRRQCDAGRVLKNVDLMARTATSYDNTAQLLVDREYFDTVMTAIGRARTSIHLAMLTLDAGVPVGQAVVNALLAKKEEVPDIAIRIIVDSIGSSLPFPWTAETGQIARLRAAGIEVVVNSFWRTRLEHRKLLVVDSQEAIFGGSCCGIQYYAFPTYVAAYRRAIEQGGAAVDEFIRLRDDPARHREMCEPEFHDFSMRVTGTAVAFLQVGFLQTWLYHGRDFELAVGETALRRKYFPGFVTAFPQWVAGLTPRERAALAGEPQSQPQTCNPAMLQARLFLAYQEERRGWHRRAPGTTSMKITNSIPHGPRHIRQTIFDVIAAARRTLDVQFAYAVIPEFEEALIAAAERGVRVRLMLPGERGYDKESIFLASRAVYPRLQDAGAEVYEFRGYNHGKVIVADDRFVWFSTGNPEPFSWDLGFDETAVLDSPELAAEVRRQILDVDFPPERGRSDLITREHLNRMSWWSWVKMKIYRFGFDVVYGRGNPGL